LARYHHTEGVCLRRIDYSNTSQVAAFLTPDAGRLSFMAKGVKRAPKKGIATGFDLLGRYEILYTARRSSALNNLTYRWLREDFRGLRARIERILCGYYAAELALNFTAEGQPCPAFYEATLAALRAFAAGEQLGVNVLRLELAALREHGSEPVLDACAECGRPLPPGGAIGFNPAAGGTICRPCEERLRGHLPLRTGRVRVELLRTLAAVSLEPSATEALKAHQTVALSSILRHHMRYLLGKELRLWKYLQRRELSRSLLRARRRAGVAP
jgi:DNA repair protein RecO (recombination protein O)